MNPAATDGSQTGKKRRAQRGSTLLELLVAVALFAIISGVAFKLMNQAQNSTANLTGQVGLNMALRNTMSMLQMDLANAGANYYQDLNQPAGTLGVTILNNVVDAGGTCFTKANNIPGGTPYGTNCFDQINVISVDPTYPVVKATDSTGGSGTSNCSDTSTGTAYGQASTATPYKVGDQLFLVTQNGKHYTSVILTALPTVSGSALKFTFNPTNSSGGNSLANDPLNISACSGNTPCPPASVPTPTQLTNTFCGSDYIMKLNYVTYSVNSNNFDSNNMQDPILTRSVNGGAASTVMEQVIGFKVGGSIWNDVDPSNVDIVNYNYDASTYTLTPGTSGQDAYNFTDLRSVRISVIGRTTPDTTNNLVYVNSFDGGRYQVQGAAMVVNPRNFNFYATE